MKRMVDRIALPFNIGRQWLTAAPRYRGAVICGVSAIGAMIAIGYNGNKGLSPRSAPVVQTSDVDSAKTNELFATRNPGWSSLDTSVEPFWSLGLARRVSFAETEAPTGAIGAKNWLPENSIWDAEVVEPFAVNNDSRSGKEGPSPTAIALYKSFLVGDSENENVAIRDKDEVKKPQRRVTSRDRDRGFSPLREIQRAREKIRRVIRRIL